MRPHQGFGSGPLHERPGLLVHRAAQEIIGRGIADIEFDGWIKACELHQIRNSEVPVFFGRLKAKCGLTQLIYWF